MRNLIIYDGSSAIDGAPIVAILTGLANASRNAGTGVRSRSASGVRSRALIFSRHI